MLSSEKLKTINSMIKTTNIKGKEYAPVSERVRAFREVMPDWRIITSIVSFSDNEWVLKAEIQDQDGDTQATGYASEKVGAGNINKTSAPENAETSAVGRALGFLGVGIAASIARACSLTTGKDIQQCYQSIFRSKLSDACDEVDLVRLLEVQQRLFEEHGRVSVVCTALFFLAIWPAPIDHAWTACKSMRLA